MVLSQKEKKRRSRASKSKKYHDMERETSRKRMAIYRAKNRAQKRASQLRSLLCPEDAAEVDAHVARQRQRLVADWFAYHGLRFDPKMLKEPAMLRSFMTKIEMHKIELQVAEYEISVIEDRDDEEEEEVGEMEARMGFVPAARLEIDRRPEGGSVVPKPLARAKGRDWLALERLEPAAIKVQARAAATASLLTGMKASSPGPMPMPRSKSEPAPAPLIRAIAGTNPPSRKHGQALVPPARTAAPPPSRKYARALGPSPSAEEQEFLSNNDIDCLITQAVAPVVTDGEEASADGELAAASSPAAPPPRVIDARPPPSRTLRPPPALPPLPTFSKGRYADEVVRSEEGIHRAVAEAMSLYVAAPRPAAPGVAASAVSASPARRRAAEEQQAQFDESVDRAVAAAMAQLSRGEPLRRRTVAPPPGVEGPVERVEDVRFRSMVLPSGGTGGEGEEEEAPEDRIVAEAMGLLGGEGPVGPVEDRMEEDVPPAGLYYKSEEADVAQSLDLPYETEEAHDVRVVAEALEPPDNREVAEAMRLFGGGLLGDAPPPELKGGKADEVPPVPQDELLRMDMECFDIGAGGLDGLGDGGLGVFGGIEEETFGAEAFLW